MIFFSKFVIYPGQKTTFIMQHVLQAWQNGNTHCRKGTRLNLHRSSIDDIISARLTDFYHIRMRSHGQLSLSPSSSR